MQKKWLLLNEVFITIIIVIIYEISNATISSSTIFFFLVCVFCSPFQFVFFCFFSLFLLLNIDISTRIKNPFYVYSYAMRIDDETKAKVWIDIKRFDQFCYCSTKRLNEQKQTKKNYIYTLWACARRQIWSHMWYVCDTNMYESVRKSRACCCYILEIKMSPKKWKVKFSVCTPPPFAFMAYERDFFQLVGWFFFRVFTLRILAYYQWMRNKQKWLRLTFL